VLTAPQAQADAKGELNWQVSVYSTIARVHEHTATATRSLGVSGSRTGGCVE